MHRNERFSQKYHSEIKNLLEVITPYLMNKYKEMPVETHELNKSLAQFLKVFYIVVEAINIRYRAPAVMFVRLEMSHLHGPRIRLPLDQELHGQFLTR